MVVAGQHRAVAFIESEMAHYASATRVIPKQPSSIQSMDINKMLKDLRAERVMIEESIIVLERIARGRGKRRGRPPQWITDAAPKGRGRPPGSKNKSKVESGVA
jgi:hypothetical protein